MADLAANPIQGGWRRNNDATASAFLHCQRRKMNQPVVIDCLRKQPLHQIGLWLWTKGP
jgi:hypothetical protein